jgi:hypothetical protein
MITKINWPTISLWLAASLLEAIVLARMASWAQRTMFVSPLSPLVLGAACGAATAVLADYFAPISPAMLRAGALAAALACIAAMHLFFYFDYCAGFSAAISTKNDPLFTMMASRAHSVSFGEFMSVGAMRSYGVLPGWLWWIVDGGLTIVACVAVAMLMGRSARREARG